MEHTIHFCRAANRMQQLDLMTDLLGTPSPECIRRIRNEKARRYLGMMRKRLPVPFAEKFPNVDPLALNLLHRLLAFDFKDRPTAEEMFRLFLLAEDFTGIHSPKLIVGASEGGAAAFKLDYKGKPVSLAQSPQLYKQIAICGDFGRAFEVGPVFRAEDLYTHRHFCEFIGLDVEMEIKEHYFEEEGAEVDPLGDLNTETERNWVNLFLRSMTLSSIYYIDIHWLSGHFIPCHVVIIQLIVTFLMYLFELIYLAYKKC